MSIKRVQKIVQSIQNGLIAQGNEKKATAKDNYMKLAVKHRGVITPQICEVTKSVLHSDNFISLDISEKIEVAETLLKSEYGEDKHASFRVFEKIHKNLTPSHIDSIKKIIQDGYVQEWASCDGLSKPLRYWTQMSSQNTSYLAEWCNDSSCLWTRRCFCVSQVPLARKGDNGNFKGYMDLLFKSCEKVIPHSERFNQLGVGWVLREMYLAEPKRTIRFIEQHYELFIREGLRYAIEKMPEVERNRLLKFQKTGEDKDQGEEEKKDIGDTNTLKVGVKTRKQKKQLNEK